MLKKQLLMKKLRGGGNVTEATTHEEVEGRRR